MQPTQLEDYIADLLEGESEWPDSALCRQTDPELFYPHSGESATTRQAKKVCGACPVQAECLRWALSNDEQHGIWGGQTADERRVNGRAIREAKRLQAA